MDNGRVEDRIRILAKNTDGLIARLETLTGRIDSAKANENQELIEYYERQFAEASVEFMNGVETILDEWYILKGQTRPPADQEVLEPDMLEEIHRTVVSIVQGAPITAQDASALRSRIGGALGSTDASPARIDSPAASAAQAREPKAPDKDAGGRVDVTG
jgi:hypothetical protein